MNKKKRKKNAIELPEGITQTMVPKYINYYEEDMISPVIGEYKRQYFRVEHPKMDKIWSSSKSVKITPLEKLEQAKQKLHDFVNNIVDTSYKLPKYVSKKVKKNGKVQLIYDRRVDGQRQSFRQTIEDYDENKLEEYVNDFMKKVNEKYP